MVKIVTDSLSDITPEYARELGIDVVPLNVHFGPDVMYKDCIDLTTDEFYQKLVTSDVHPSTSAPPPGVFVELFKKLLNEADGIVAIMASNKISAVGESAVQAKAMMDSDPRIEVINSEQLVGAQSILVLDAVEAAKKGDNLKSIADMVRNSIAKVHSRMVFDTLEYLKKGGRIGKAQALLGGILKIHPILGLKDGEIVPFGRARSRAQAVEYLVNFVKSFPNAKRLVVEHATTPDEMDSLVEKLSEIVPKEKIYKSRVGAVIGVHTGPHVLAVCLHEG